MKPQSQNLRADARKNYEVIVATATKMLALPNITFSFNELARRAGVGIGTLYRHFPAKKTLVEAVYADKLTTLDTQAFQKVPADLAFEKWLHQLVDFSATLPGFDVLIDEALKDIKSPIFMAGTELLKKAQNIQNLRADVTLSELLGLVKGIVGARPSVDAPQHIEKMFSVVMAGLRR